MAPRQELYTIFADLFDVDISSISPSSSKDNIERWDSMGTIDLVAEIEKSFGIRFELLEVENLHSVEIIEALLQEKGVKLED